MTPAEQHGKLLFTEYALKNGLAVVLHEDHTVPVVAVDVCYHVGSKDENPERTGFAHLFEHLMFDGSPNVKRGEFDQYITKAGGWSNAYTSWDKTNYFEVLPSHQLELALWLESDRMSALTISDVSLDTQRKVVKEERRWRVENQPYGTAEERVFSAAYTRHPYRWPIIGSMEHLDRASLDDVNEFFRQFYAPENAVLILAGDFDPATVQSLISRYFGGIRPAPGYRTNVPAGEPAQNSERRVTVHDHVRFPAAYAAYHIPQEGDPGYYAIALLSDILSNGESSRLYKSLVYEKQLAQQVISYVYNLEQPGLLWISAIAMDNVPASSLEEEILAQVNRLVAEPVGEKELRKVKNQTESNITFGKQRVDQKADLLAHYRAIHGSTELINEQIELFEAVTVDDIQRVAREYLTERNRTIVHFLPYQSPAGDHE